MSTVPAVEKLGVSQPFLGVVLIIPGKHDASGGEIERSKLFLAAVVMVSGKDRASGGVFWRQPSFPEHVAWR